MDVQKASLAHNLIIDGFLCHGIVGMSLITTAIAKFYLSMFATRRQLKKQKKDRSISGFVIAVAIAFLFHKSALILLLMYSLYWARITKKWLVAIVPAMVAIFALNRPIFAFLQKLISDFYTTAATETKAYTMLVLFVLLAVFAFVIPDDKECDFDLIGFRNLLLFAIVIQMFVPLHTLAMRFNYYYIIFIPLLISKVVKYRSKRYNQVALLAKYVMIVFFVCYFFINTSSRNPLDIYPYKFFFSDI